MNYKNISIDVYVGAFLTTVGIFLFNEADKFSSRAALFPKITITLFIIFSFLMTINGVRASRKNIVKNEKNKTIKFEEIRIPLLIFLFVTVYTIALRYIGFYISTAIFIPSVMIFYKSKNILSIVFSTAGVIIFIHLLFVVKLRLTLP